MEVRRVPMDSGVCRLYSGSSLIQGLGHGVHRYEVATSGFSAWAARWIANAEVRNDVRGGITGAKDTSVPLDDLISSQRNLRGTPSA